MGYFPVAPILLHWLHIVRPRQTLHFDSLEYQWHADMPVSKLSIQLELLSVLHVLILFEYI